MAKSKTQQYYDKNPDAKAKKAAYDTEYNKKTVKDRVARNAARRALIKAGKVKKGDGKDVDHKNNNPRDNRRSNLSVMKKSRNRAKH
jgi:hypothetical protein